jgi:isoamylase
MVNAWWEPLTFRLPPTEAGHNTWQRWIDTSRPSPEDVVPRGSAPEPVGDTYTLEPRSVVVLTVELSPGATGADGHPDPPAAGHG